MGGIKTEIFMRLATIPQNLEDFRLQIVHHATPQIIGNTPLRAIVKKLRNVGGRGQGFMYCRVEDANAGVTTYLTQEYKKTTYHVPDSLSVWVAVPPIL